MGHVPLLDELAIVAALAVLVTVVLSRLKLPTVAGLLASGALVGPYGLAWATSVEAIEVLAEVGVVLLLFTIGLEFSLTKLRDVFRRAAVGGLLQVSLTGFLAFGAARAFGEPVGRSILYGFVFALSSTAIVLRALSERQELAAPHGRFVVGTLIFQDICVVPMMLITPVLAGAQDSSVAVGLGIALGKAVAVVAATLGISRVVAPTLLRLVDASRSREIFLLAILGLCIGTAWLTSLAGLSLALGAFLGGMVVADTEYGHRAMGDILPLRDAFVSIFFVSLGMLFDVQVMMTHPWLVAGFLIGFVFIKGGVATLAALLARFPARAAFLSGVGLAQFGEFGFVLTRVAEASGLATREQLQPVLAAGILSMFSAPLLIRLAPALTLPERLLRPVSRLLSAGSVDDSRLEAETAGLNEHVILIGLGVAGKLCANALLGTGHSLVAMELNSQNVREGQAEGIPVFNADATSVEALEHAGISRAKLVVIVINDPAAATRVVDTIRRCSPETAVIVRTRYLAERAALLELGARDAVADEVEGAVEMMARVLRFLGQPRNAIEEQIKGARERTQSSQRKQTLPRQTLNETPGLEELKVDALLVRPGTMGVGRSAVELAIRSRTGASILGLRRAG